MEIKPTIERMQGCVRTDIKGGWLIPLVHTSGKRVILGMPRADL